MAKCDVSIIVPVYNVEQYIRACLESVMGQSAECAIECILVDDCGSDNSMGVVRELIDKYTGPIEFRIVTKEKNGGLSAARNSGIRAAEGTYIYLLDSDDLIMPDCIAKLFALAKKYPDAEIIIGNFQSFPQKDVYIHISLAGRDFPEYSDDVNWIRKRFLTTIPVTAWNKLIKRKFITENNLYFREGILHEDNHWMANAYHSIKRVAFEFSETYLYRMREGSITMSPKADENRFENLFVIYKEMFEKAVKWDYPWGCWIVASLTYFRRYKLAGSEDRPAKYSRILVKSLVKNPKTPLCAKLLFAYYAIPQWAFWPRLYYSLIYRYMNTYPKHE